MGGGGGGARPLLPQLKLYFINQSGLIILVDVTDRK